VVLATKVKMTTTMKMMTKMTCLVLAVLLVLAAVVEIEGDLAARRRTFNDWGKAPVTLACEEKNPIEHDLFKNYGYAYPNQEEGKDVSGTRYRLTGGGSQKKKYVWREDKKQDGRHTHTNIPPLEQAYMDQNKRVTEEEFHHYMLSTRMREDLPPYKVKRSFGDSNVFEKRCRPRAPKLGVAISGGSFRSFLNAAGILSAMDKRLPEAVEAGTGGLLQSMSYIAGESGGAWLLGAWYSQGLPTLNQMLHNIHLNESIVFPGGSEDLPFFGEVVSSTLRATAEKTANGFNVSLADIYAGLISQSILPGRAEVPFDTAMSGGLTLSALSQVEAVQNFSAPIPIMISLQKDEETVYNGLDSCPPANIWEWSIFESGTFAGNVSRFVRSDQIGSLLRDGALQNEGECAQGGDSLAWVLATATAAYSQASHKAPLLARLEECMQSPSLLHSATCHLLRHNVLDLSLDRDSERTHLTTPAQIPNPFRDVAEVKGSSDDEMYFTDVGPCEQIPLFSLLQRGRDLDVIFALDATEGNTSWPSGLALSLSAAHARREGLSVPETPNLEEFQTQERLTTKATFFGCYHGGSDADAEAQPPPPAIVYMPNHMVSYASNSSYGKLKWAMKEQEAMLQNGFDQLTEDDLPLCLSCLLSSRQKKDDTSECEEDGEDGDGGGSEWKWPTPRRGQCERCFQKYCWTPPQGHHLDDWETTSRAVDEINEANFDGILASLLSSD
jgi:lysophospholipase